MPDTGPFVAMAVFCDQTIEAKDGTLSVIRVIDQLAIGAQGPDVPDQMPEGQFQTKCAITLKAGEARGRHSVSLIPEMPSGIRHDPMFSVPVQFEGGHRGTNILVDLQLPIQMEGLHWYDVVLDDAQRLSRIPLLVTYRPLRTSG